MYDIIPCVIACVFVFGHTTGNPDPKSAKFINVYNNVIIICKVSRKRTKIFYLFKYIYIYQNLHHTYRLTIILHIFICSHIQKVLSNTESKTLHSFDTTAKDSTNMHENSVWFDHNKIQLEQKYYLIWPRYDFIRTKKHAIWPRILLHPKQSNLIKNNPIWPNFFN